MQTKENRIKKQEKEYLQLVKSFPKCKTCVHFLNSFCREHETKRYKDQIKCFKYEEKKVK